MITYIIIGIIICMYGCTRLLDKGKYTEEEMFSSPACLFGMTIIVFAWPIILGWALHDVIKEIKEEGL